MGLVVAARHTSTDQLVAIKLMLQDAWQFGNAIERFVLEARAASQLTSQNIAQLLDVGTLDDGSPFMVMEYLEGITMTEVIRRHGALAVDDAMDFGLHVCAAMAEAHEKGIIHRDLKPGNLFLTQQRDGTVLVKVLDFGLSKLIDAADERDLQITDTMGTIGSPSYMSPEQARSAKYTDERSDIWSLGVTLYQMLTAHLPFQAESRAELFAAILREDPTPVRTHAPWVPRQLESVIMHCLLKEPEQRYQTVTALASDLTPFASDRGREFCKSSFLPVRWFVAPPAPPDSLITDANSSIIIEAPDKLDIGDFFSALPTKHYELPTFDSIAPVDDMSEDVTAFVTERPPRSSSGKWAIFGMIVIVLGIALGWVAFQFTDEKAEAGTETREPGAAAIEATPGLADDSEAKPDVTPDDLVKPPGDPDTADSDTAAAPSDDVDDQVTDDQATDDQATDDQATDDQATDDQAADDQAVEPGDGPKARKSKRKRSKRKKRRKKRSEKTSDQDDSEDKKKKKKPKDGDLFRTID